MIESSLFKEIYLIFFYKFGVELYTNVSYHLTEFLLKLKNMFLFIIYFIHFPKCQVYYF